MRGRPARMAERSDHAVTSSRRAVGIDVPGPGQEGGSGLWVHPLTCDDEGDIGRLVPQSQQLTERGDGSRQGQDVVVGPVPPVEAFLQDVTGAPIVLDDEDRGPVLRRRRCKCAGGDVRRQSPAGCPATPSIVPEGALAHMVSSIKAAAAARFSKTLRAGAGRGHHPKVDESGGNVAVGSATESVQARERGRPPRCGSSRPACPGCGWCAS